MTAARATLVALSATHRTAALDLDAGNAGAVQGERTLNAFAVGDLAHDEARVQATVAAGNHHTFVSLQALARAFNHVDAHDDRVARGKDRNGFVQTSNFFLLKGLDQVHRVLQKDRADAGLKWMSDGLEDLTLPGRGSKSCGL
jgi:hypothetical protein